MPNARTMIFAGLAISMLAAAADAQRSRGQDRRMQLEPGALKVGQYAPTFALKSLDSTETFELKEFRGKKPVIHVLRQLYVTAVSSPGRRNGEDVPELQRHCRVPPDLHQRSPRVGRPPAG